MGVEWSRPEVGPSVAVCDRWEDFHEAVAVDDLSAIARLWRGHADLDWLLESVLEREVRRPGFRPPGWSGRKEAERRQAALLRDFKRNVLALPSVTEAPTPANKGWEALARQHGLDSNLLDWTRSPYIAAFFAFAEAVQEPGRIQDDSWIAVWSLTDDPALRRLSDFTVLDDALPGNPRLHAQQGLFAKLQAPDHLDLQSFLVSQVMGKKLTRVEVPGRAVWSALANLQQMGIAYTRLFPDFDGAAKDANIGDRYTRYAAFERSVRRETP